MVIFIDGPQQVGKSTLIESMGEKGWVECHKFPFSEYSKAFNLQVGQGLKGFQISKDLACLHWLSEFPPSARSTKVLIDRGPLSTIYYSYLLGRMDYAELERFFEKLKKYQKIGSFGYVFITAKNQPELPGRNKKDGFDGLSAYGDTEKALSYIKTKVKEYGLNFCHFENDFSKTIKENYWDLWAEILRLGCVVNDD